LGLAREVLDRDRGALEEVVDLVAVVAAERLFDLAASELLRCYVHQTSLWLASMPPANERSW
jgi:hypothetical protein